VLHRDGDDRVEGRLGERGVGVAEVAGAVASDPAVVGAFGPPDDADGVCLLGEVSSICRRAFSPAQRTRMEPPVQ